MDLIRRFVGFWIDFIFGDAWEVAIGIGLAMLVCAAVLRDRANPEALGFGLIAVVLAANGLALWRIAAAHRG